MKPLFRIPDVRSHLLAGRNLGRGTHLRELVQADQGVPHGRGAGQEGRKLLVEHAVAVVVRGLPWRQRGLMRAQPRQPLVQRAHRAHARPGPHQPCDNVRSVLQGLQVMVRL